MGERGGGERREGTVRGHCWHGNLSAILNLMFQKYIRTLCGGISRHIKYQSVSLVCACCLSSYSWWQLEGGREGQDGR